MRKISLFVLAILLLSGIFRIVYAQDDCPPSRLIPYQHGQVTPGTSNRMRDEPSLSSALEGSIPGGSMVYIYQTGTCTDGYLWVKVEYGNKIAWTVEAKGSVYYIEPVPPPDGAVVLRSDVNDVAWSADSHTIALATSSGVYLLDANLSTPIPKLFNQDTVEEVEFNPAVPDMLATSAEYGLLRVWDIATKKVLYESITGSPNNIAVQGNGVGLLQFSNDGKLMFAVTQLELDAYDTTSWQPAHVLSYDVTNAAMSPDGQQVAVVPPYPDKPYLADWSGKQTPLNTGDLDTEAILHMRFSPDSTMLAMSDSVGHVVRDILATGQADTYTAQSGGQVHVTNGLVFSPDSKLLAIGDFTEQGGVERLVNTATMQQIGTLAPNRVDKATWIAFSPEGSKIASVFDNVLLIVNTADVHD